MHDLYENLEELCETVSEEITSANDKIRSAGGKLTSGDVDYLDKLTHMLKSIKTTKAMMDEGYSNDMGSYARRRDGMGRYSRENRRSYDGKMYSYDDGNMVSELRELMNEAPNAQVRQKFQQFISDIERMK